MTKRPAVLISIGILAVIICLQLNLAYGESYEENIKIRKLAIKSALVQSAERLLLQEIELIKTIDKARYMGLETELPPLEPELMADVVYLLDWALRIDPNDVKANFLLGKIYYLQHDLGEGFADRKIVNLGVRHLARALRLSSQGKQGLKDSEKIEGEKMLDELKKIPEGAFGKSGE